MKGLKLDWPKRPEDGMASIKRYLIHMGINGDRAAFKSVNRLFAKYPELWTA
jgi:hypothetical protein